MSGEVHPVDQILPTPRLLALGLQHVLVMYAGAVAVPLIIGRALKLPPEDGPQPVLSAPPNAEVDEAALRDVLVFLRTRTGRDFSYYKRATIIRRVARRMQVNSVESALRSTCGVHTFSCATSTT